MEDRPTGIAAPSSADERNTLRDLLQRIAGGAGLIPGVHPGLAYGAMNLLGDGKNR